ncbi:MAG: outer membrane protein assembly factor BamA [Desulfopila sp.]
MKFFRQHSLSFCSRPAPAALALVVTALLLIPVFSQAAETTTAFMPLKVNSARNVTELTGSADKYLAESLAGHGITLVPRSQAQALANYQGTWPPPPTVLQNISSSTGKDNIAVGSLTMIGNRISVDLKVFDSLTPATPQYFYSETNTLQGLSTAIDSVVLDALAYTQRDLRIGTISPEGNKRIDSGAILRKISSRAGGAYNPATLREDLKAIYSMGYFNDVQIDVTDGPKGKDVVFKVVEKPTIAAVNFKGVDELKEEDVRGAANIRQHYILNPNAINAGAEAIKQLYKSKGYYNTQVHTDISYPSDEGAVVTYTVDEGKKIYIKKISFEGNTAYDDDELLSQIETKEKGFFSWITASGRLEMDVIKQDEGKIISFYNNHGYMDARISEPEISQEDEWLYITFKISEGNRYKVGTVGVSGDLITDQTTLVDLLTIRDKEYIDLSAVREDVMSITDYYAEKGYAFAEARPAMDKSASGDRVDITYRITKGDLVYINRIIIKGNTRTRDNVIRRELRVAEGGIFNSKALRESSQGLQRLQFFDEVNITPEPTIEPNQMNINIEVKERSTGTFSIGAGYSSVDHVILMGSIAENNFLGRGDQLAFTGNISGRSSRYNISYTNPHVFDSELSWGADLFNTKREYDDYTKNSTGGGMRVGYPLYEKWRIFGNYSYTNTDLSNIDDDASYYIKESSKVPITSSVEVSMVRDTRDKVFGATEGSRHMASIQHAGGIFFGDAEFTKVEASTSWFFPLFWKTTLHIKGAAGQAFEKNTDSKFPVYERYYLGGISTVRGFKYGKISPKDQGDRIGGDQMWYTNTEFIFPLLESQGLQGLFFFDAGQVYGNLDRRSDDSPETSAGFGINWLSPMGPIVIVWGANLNPNDSEDKSALDFTIGGTF